MEIPGFDYDPVLKRYFKKVNQGERLQISSTVVSTPTPKAIVTRKAVFCNKGPFPFFSATVTETEWRPLSLISWLKSETPAAFKSSYCSMDGARVLFRKDETYILYFRQEGRIMKMRREDHKSWYTGSLFNICTFYQCTENILLYSGTTSLSIQFLGEDQPMYQFSRKPPSCCLADIESGNLFMGFHDRIDKAKITTHKLKERFKIQSEALSMLFAASNN